jgi:hypothetical protein
VVEHEQAISKITIFKMTFAVFCCIWIRSEAWKLRRS